MISFVDFVLLGILAYLIMLLTDEDIRTATIQELLTLIETLFIKIKDITLPTLRSISTLTFRMSNSRTENSPTKLISSESYRRFNEGDGYFAPGQLAKRSSSDGDATIRIVKSEENIPSSTLFTTELDKNLGTIKRQETPKARHFRGIIVPRSSSQDQATAKLLSQDGYDVISFDSERVPPDQVSLECKSNRKKQIHQELMKTTEPESSRRSISKRLGRRRMSADDLVLRCRVGRCKDFDSETVHSETLSEREDYKIDYDDYSLPDDPITDDEHVRDLVKSLKEGMKKWYERLRQMEKKRLSHGQRADHRKTLERIPHKRRRRRKSTSDINTLQNEEKFMSFQSDLEYIKSISVSDNNGDDSSMTSREFPIGENDMQLISEDSLKISNDTPLQTKHQKSSEVPSRMQENETKLDPAVGKSRNGPANVEKQVVFIEKISHLDKQAGVDVKKGAEKGKYDRKTVDSNMGSREHSKSALLSPGSNKRMKSKEELLEALAIGMLKMYKRDVEVQKAQNEKEKEKIGKDQAKSKETTVKMEKIQAGKEESRLKKETHLKQAETAAMQIKKDEIEKNRRQEMREAARANRMKMDVLADEVLEIGAKTGGKVGASKSKSHWAGKLPSKPKKNGNFFKLTTGKLKIQHDRRRTVPTTVSKYDHRQLKKPGIGMHMSQPTGASREEIETPRLTRAYPVTPRKDKTQPPVSWGPPEKLTPGGLPKSPTSATLGSPISVSPVSMGGAGKQKPGTASRSPISTTSTTSVSPVSQGYPEKRKPGHSSKLATSDSSASPVSLQQMHLKISPKDLKRAKNSSQDTKSKHKVTSKEKTDEQTIQREHKREESVTPKERAMRLTGIEKPSEDTAMKETDAKKSHYMEMMPNPPTHQLKMASTPPRPRRTHYIEMVPEQPKAESTHCLETRPPQSPKSPKRKSWFK